MDWPSRQMDPLLLPLLVLLVLLFFEVLLIPFLFGLGVRPEQEGEE